MSVQNDITEMNVAVALLTKQVKLILKEIKSSENNSEPRDL